MIGHCVLTHCYHSNPYAVTKTDCLSCEYRELSAAEIENLIAEGIKKINGMDYLTVSRTQIYMRKQDLLKLITDSKLLSTSLGFNGPHFWMFGLEIVESDSLDRGVRIYFKTEVK